MDQSQERELYHRLSQLENDIADIKEVLSQLAPGATPPTRPSQPSTPSAPPASSQPTSATPPPPPTRPAPEQPARPEATSVLYKRAPRPTASPAWTLPEHMRKGEFWLKIMGIGLILFGVAFGFKYSIEQGWINPQVRHLFGLAVGLILMIFGLRLYGRRPAFALVLQGGSIGVFYITCFSAFQLFEFI